LVLQRKKSVEEPEKDGSYWRKRRKGRKDDVIDFVANANKPTIEQKRGPDIKKFMPEGHLFGSWYK